MRKLSLFILCSVLIFSCSNSKDSVEEDLESISSDPLPSWNEGGTKEAITSFVNSVTDPESKDFVEVKDRIATFDNDGNLWAEQPVYFQLYFALDLIKEMAVDHPEWESDPLFSAVLADDLITVSSFGEEGLINIIMASHSGMNTDQFELAVADWITTAKHPETGKLYTEMIYQPMLELIKYLQANDFKVFIVSGGGIEFMRVWAEDVYGIPKDQIIGSSIETVFDIIDGDPMILRLPKLGFINDKGGKPVAIQHHIGRKPIFASGNSDGDLQMLQWSDENDLPSFQLYLHHTDAEREWAYDRDSHVGKLDKGLDEAAAKGWTVIDMKEDWKVVWLFE